MASERRFSGEILHWRNTPTVVCLLAVRGISLGKRVCAFNDSVAPVEPKERQYWPEREQLSMKYGAFVPLYADTAFRLSRTMSA